MAIKCSLQGKVKRTYNQTKNEASSSAREQSIPKIQVVELSSINEQNRQACSYILIVQTCILVPDMGFLGRKQATMERTRVKLFLGITWWVSGTRVDHEGNGSGQGNALSKPSRPKNRKCQNTNGGTTNLSHEHIVLLHNWYYLM